MSILNVFVLVSVLLSSDVYRSLIDLPGFGFTSLKYYSPLNKQYIQFNSIHDVQKVHKYYTNPIIQGLI
jgi:GTP-binding protein EngB required for normal cell division